MGALLFTAEGWGRGCAVPARRGAGVGMPLTQSVDMPPAPGSPVRAMCRVAW